LQNRTEVVKSDGAYKVSNNDTPSKSKKTAGVSHQTAQVSPGRRNGQVPMQFAESTQAYPP